jgi:hypothetical protein
VEVSKSLETLECESCDWTRAVQAGDLDEQERPQRCLACCCDDLWRQKDFPQKVGVLIVGVGILLSTIAWHYFQILLAIGILMGFALLDLALYSLMRDVLVCYSCGARHRHIDSDDHHAGFNLETAEKHRQEAARLADSK